MGMFNHAMKKKAVIFNNDRTTTVRVINKKMAKTNAGFMLDGEFYQTDSDNAVITVNRKLGFPIKFITFYYKRGIPASLPAPNFFDVRVTYKTDKDGNYLLDNNGNKIPLKKEFFGVKTVGINSEELGTLFTPEFYRMIARPGGTKKQDLTLILQVITLIGVAYIGYFLTTQLPDAIADAIAALQNK